MAVTKLDISLAARAAGHLYLTTGIVAAGFFGALAAWITYPFRRQVGHLSLMTDIVSPTFLSIGFLSALYYARRELNSWAYVIATPCAVLLVALTGVGIFLTDLSTLEKMEIDDVIVNVPKLGLLLFITIYLVRIPIDYSRLALSGHNASRTPPLRLANGGFKTITPQTQFATVDPYADQSAPYVCLRDLVFVICGFNYLSDVPW
jgi:hypothetical protein